MKKFILAIILLFYLCVSSPSFAWEPPVYVDYSGTQTGDALVLNSPGWFYGLWVATDGANAVTITVYDGVAAAGNELAPTQVIPTSATNRGQTVGFTYPIRARTGIYVDVTTVGTVEYKVYYRRR